MNNYSCIGRLVNDIDVFNANSGPIASGRIAINEGKKTVFIDYKAFGKTAELMTEHLAKGDQVGLMGRISQDEWEDKGTGTKRNKHLILVNSISFISNNKRRDAAPAAEPADPGEGGSGNDNSDMPF